MANTVGKSLENSLVAVYVANQMHTNGDHSESENMAQTVSAHVPYVRHFHRFQFVYDRLDDNYNG